MKQKTSNYKILIFTIIALLSCSAKKEKDKSIEITIQYTESDRYDLKNGIYNIFYMSKPPLEVKFTLSNEEKNKIIDKYYALDLKEMPENIYIDDKCMLMPKFYTELYINSKDKQQIIKIDKHCDSFKWSDYFRANKIKKFLKVVDDILKEKPEIKNAPQSNIIYL